MTYADYQSLRAEASALIEQELAQLMPTGARGVTVQGGSVSLLEEPAAPDVRGEEWGWLLFGRFERIIVTREGEEVEIESSGWSPWSYLGSFSLRGQTFRATPFVAPWTGYLSPNPFYAESLPWREERVQAALMSRVMRYTHLQEARVESADPQEVQRLLDDASIGGGSMRLLFNTWFAAGYAWLAEGLPAPYQPQGDVTVLVGRQPVSFGVSAPGTGFITAPLVGVNPA